MQLRLANKTLLGIYHDGNKHVINSELTCLNCNSREMETQYNVMFACTLYKYLRAQYIEKLLKPNKNHNLSIFFQYKINRGVIAEFVSFIFIIFLFKELFDFLNAFCTLY